ncbi:MAG: hypothetical protein ACLFO2_04915 [Candidatus Woesearchaeota archaeon]
MSLLWLLLATLALFIISAIPLWIAVQMLGGRGSVFRVIGVNLLVGLVAFAVRAVFDTWAGLIVFILMIWIYKDFFSLGWIRALLAWLLQFVFAALLILLAVILLGPVTFL